MIELGLAQRGRNSAGGNSASKSSSGREARKGRRKALRAQSMFSMFDFGEGQTIGQ